jgi:hypothetical protein
VNAHARIRTSALVATTVLVAAIAMWRAWAGTTPATFAYWLIACVAGEVLWIRLPLGSATISMASCFNFAALLVVTRGEAMAVTALATLIAEIAIMRKSPVRALFNASQTALAVTSAVWMFDWAGGGSHDLVAMISSFRLLPFALAAACYYAVNRGAVSLAVASSTGVSPLAAWRSNFGSQYELLSGGAVFSLGVLVATHYSAIGMAGTLLVALPLVFACDAMRRYSRRESRPAELPDSTDRAA